MDQRETSDVLDEITRRLREALSPKAIYLYGSQASGEPHAGSDFDVLVIVAESELDFFDRAAAAYRALGGVGVPVDVQVYTEREFEDRAALPVSFERTVRSRGKLLYAA